MGFLESLIMTIFTKKAVKEIAKSFSDEHPSPAAREGSMATYYNLRNVFYHVEDFSPMLLEELFRYEPDFLDKESGEDVRELLGVQVTHYLFKSVLHSSETWFTISAQNRYICKELLSTIMDRNFRSHDLIDYSNRLFSPIANPAQHSITIGDYTLYYKYALYYNLTLMLLIDADKNFLSGKRVADRAVCYPKVKITDEIVNQYGLAVDESIKAGVRVEKQSYAVLDDFNSPDAYEKRTGWFEIRIIDGTFKSNDIAPYSIEEMRAAEQSVSGGFVWPSIIPGYVNDGGTYVPGVPFHFLGSADALTIRGSEHTCELYVCRLQDGWGGIRFKLQNKADYYRLAAWLIPVLSYYCGIIRGWDYRGLIHEYWPTYPLNDSDVCIKPIIADEPVCDVKIPTAPITPTLRSENQGRRIAASQKEQFLLDTYYYLRANYSANCCALWDLIGQMAKINRENAVLIWKELMAANPDVLHSSSDFGFSVMYQVQKAIGSEWTYRLVAEDEGLRNAIYSELGDMQLSPLFAIQFFVLINAVHLADELLELTFHNRYRCNSFYEVLDSIIPDFSEKQITDEAVALLMKWIERIENPEEKVKLKLKMLHFMDEVKV